MQTPQLLTRRHVNVQRNALSRPALGTLIRRGKESRRVHAERIVRAVVVGAVRVARPEFEVQQAVALGVRAGQHETVEDSERTGAGVCWT